MTGPLVVRVGGAVRVMAQNPRGGPGGRGRRRPERGAGIAARGRARHRPAHRAAAGRRRAHRRGGHAGRRHRGARGRGRAGPSWTGCSGGAVHQGLVLRVRPYEYAHPDDLVAAAAKAGQPPLIVALDGVTDPRNLGAVARSVAAFGGHGVLVPVRRSAGVTAGAWKASAGALARVPVAQASNLAAALVGYQEAGLFAVGLTADGEVHGRRPRAGRRAAGARGRVRGPGAVPAGGAAVRRPDPDPDAGRGGVAERGRRRRDRAVRGGQAAGRPTRLIPGVMFFPSSRGYLKLGRWSRMVGITSRNSDWWGGPDAARARLVDELARQRQADRPGPRGRVPRPCPGTCSCPPARPLTPTRTRPS